MAVFTIYCHGSGGHRDKPDKEIVAYMGRRATGIEYQDYLILDGVGGKPTGKNSPNPMAGTFNWADKNKAAKGAIGMGFGQREFSKHLDEYTQHSGYFINEHHRVLFESNCPDLYRWLFTRASAQAGLQSKAVAANSPIGREVAGAAPVRPNFVESLQRLGVKVDGNIVRLPAPGSALDPRQIHDIQARGNLTAMGLL
ncbi:MAG: DUF5621 domain-containing protein [Planctomycetes bacterium]|nr:DUF5621 domain-containing protein [Planctomycetota bacterium]